MRISVIGSGYVGLVTGTCFAEMGNHVICVDNDPGKLAKLKDAEITIYEPGLELYFYRNIAKGRLSFTSDLRQATLESEVLFLCLPTPQGENGSADLQYVLGVADEIGRILAEANCDDYKIVVDKSTVPVGTAGKVAGLIGKHGVTCCDVVSNPEFLREGYAVEDFMKPDRIVIGAESQQAMEKMKELYDPFVRQGNPIIFMDTASAEITKYASNAYLATRITFMNELANFTETVGADIDLVRKGMGTDSRIGKRFLFAGIGYGGSCFPKDVNALIRTAEEHGSGMRILSEVDRVNKAQKVRLVDKALSHFGGDVKGRHFAIWGLAFKPNTDDMREAPSIYIVRKLLSLGATVSVYDPAAMETARFYLKEAIEAGTVTYANKEYDALSGADALFILTEWNEFRNPEFDQIKNALKAPVLFDGRNIFKPNRMQELGFTYYSVGRESVRPSQM